MFSHAYTTRGGAAGAGAWFRLLPEGAAGAAGAGVAAAAICSLLMTRTYTAAPGIASLDASIVTVKGM